MKAAKSSRRNRFLIPCECSPLEGRLLFAAVYPTPQEQYLLQLINRARANPTAEVQRSAPNWPSGVTPDLNEGIPAGTIPSTPKQPLAMNPFLVDAARKHSQYLVNNPGTTLNAHLEPGPNGTTIGPVDRMIAAGYPLPVDSSNTENVWGTYGNFSSDNVQTDMEDIVDNTFIDYVTNTMPTDGRGHRVQLMDPGVNEIGLGLATTQVPTGATTNTLYQSTQDFANAGKGSFLCGVAFNDLNNDQFYEPGEELANVTITATRSDGQVFSTTTWSAGGYSLALQPGSYVVTATGGSVGTPMPQNVTIGTQNVEADFIAANSTPAPPVIISQPQSTTPPLSAKSFSFGVSASGYPVPSVQWQMELYGDSTFTNINGATTYTYSAPVDPALNGSQVPGSADQRIGDGDKQCGDADGSKCAIGQARRHHSRSQSIRLSTPATP